MKKYYISTIIGDGTEENAFRPKISDYPHGDGGSMSRTTKDGDDWCLCWVESVDHSPWATDTDIVEVEEF